MVHSEAFNGMKVTLCNERTEKVWVTVTAFINGGRLTVEGQDLGSAPSEWFGSDEYEYCYCFDRENTEKLLSAITENGGHPSCELQRRFSGMTGCCNLRAFCEKNAIKYSFNSFT